MNNLDIPYAEMELRVLSAMEQEDTLRMKLAMVGENVSHTIDDLNLAIDKHWLWVRMNSGRYWQCRRNGATKRWKRDPERFRVPVKFGLKGTDAIVDLNSVGPASSRKAGYVISEFDPNIPMTKKKVSK